MRQEPSQLKLVAGGPHNCFFSKTEVWCWGWNYYSALGVDTNKTLQALKPHKLEQNFSDIQMLSLGTNHGCLVDSKKVWCWGWNKFNQASAVASDSTINKPTPILLPFATSKVSSVGSHSCALLENNQIYCWGKNFYGQTGQRPAQEPAHGAFKVEGLPQGRITDIKSNYHHNCAKAENELWCWGWNEMGQLGDKDGLSWQPRRVTLPDGTLHSFALGSFHTCAVIRESAYCWGRNDLGQIGLKDRGNHFEPRLVSGKDRVLEIHAGYKHTCYRTEKELKCTGWNLAGQLGYETKDDHSLSFQPVKIKIKPHDKLTFGYAHNCLKREDQFYCWGTNRFGQLGVGKINSSLRPIKIDTQGIN
jgi:alpha-tubulin suppressor-like RCC1 family protein